MDNINLTVGELKEILNNEDLSDDMLVVIPVSSEDDPNYISSFRNVKTAGILECSYEEHKAFVLNASKNGADISKQLTSYRGDVSLNKVLY